MLYASPKQRCFLLSPARLSCEFEGAPCPDFGSLFRGVDRQSGLTERLAAASMKTAPSYLDHPYGTCGPAYDQIASGMQTRMTPIPSPCPLFPRGIERAPLDAEQD